MQTRASVATAVSVIVYLYGGNNWADTDSRDREPVPSLYCLATAVDIPSVLLKPNDSSNFSCTSSRTLGSYRHPIHHEK